MTQHKLIAWTIAGSDSGGGAGIQADLATFRDFGVHGCSVITALTAQNSFAVGHIEPTPRKNFAAQINALDSDMLPRAIKLGMLATSDVVASVAKYLEGYSGFVVCDPVLHASSGASLLEGDAKKILLEKLLPRVDLLTPNRAEAEALLGRSLCDLREVEQGAKDLVAMGARSVLITGGHFEMVNNRRFDYWTDGQEGCWLSGENIATVHTHGTGCTLSAAIAAAIARGFLLADALVLAKMYVTRGLRDAVQIGGGPGAVAHSGWPNRIEDLPVLSRGFTSNTQLHFPDCDGELGLYPVVDSVEWIARLLPLGIKTIQLRIKNKNTDDAELERQIAEAVILSRRYGARLFINDYWQLALKYRAYGVHLGQEDLDKADLSAIANAGLRLGVSNHSYYELARAHGIRPSYLALGPIFPTTTKQMKFSEQGVDQLREWVHLLKPAYRLTAIGGINIERAGTIAATGVGSVALVSAITQAHDYTAATKKLIELCGN